MGETVVGALLYLPPPCLWLSPPLGDPASRGGRILTVGENGRLAPSVSGLSAFPWLSMGRFPG